MAKKPKALKLEKLDELKPQLDEKKAKKAKKEKEKKLEKPAPHADEVGRLNRVSGQIQGIAGMLDKGRDLNDVLTQFKAVHSALRSIELRVFDTYATQAIEDITAAEKRKEREGKMAELKNLLAKG